MSVCYSQIDPGLKVVRVEFKGFFVGINCLIVKVKVVISVTKDSIDFFYLVSRDPRFNCLLEFNDSFIIFPLLERIDPPTGVLVTISCAVATSYDYYRLKKYNNQRRPKRLFSFYHTISPLTPCEDTLTKNLKLGFQTG